MTPEEILRQIIKRCDSYKFDWQCPFCNAAHNEPHQPGCLIAYAKKVVEK